MAFTLLKRCIPTRNVLFTTTRNNGYIILVPEIGEEAPDKNPLLHNDGLPEFTNITIENCMAAIAKQTLDFEAGVKDIEKGLTERESNIFTEVFKELELTGALLDTTWGLSKTLYLGNSSLMPTKSYIAIHERARRARAAKYNSVGIYERVKKELLENITCTEEQVRVLKKFALEGKLNGLDLPEKERGALKQYMEKLMTERTQFKQKLDVSTKQFSHNITEASVVRDFPLELLKSMAPNSGKPHEGPWRVSLQPDVYMPVMEHCPDRDVRMNIWQALVSRGSGYGERELSTGIHLEGIRQARREMAKLLGYETYADMSMETKMAGSVKNVQDMLETLRSVAKPTQVQELETLHQFATERGFTGSRIELWDVPFWRRKQQLALFNYTELDYKKYFVLSSVLDGMFKLCEKLFNVVIKQRAGVSTWHRDVRFYDVFEPHLSAPIGGFYVDPYARSDEKIKIQQNSGWMVGVANHSRIAETRPLAALIFNFQPAVEAVPSLLSFREVKHLFHKFGLALQHLLTRTNYSEVSGSSNIEWDAVEVSGCVLAHWLGNKEVIKSISCHWESKEQLPDDMVVNLIKIQRHLSGLDLSKELYLAALDLELHVTKDFWLQVMQRLWPEYRSFPLIKLDSHPCSFTQIFTEEWAAAYYSHVWARVIAADVFSAFYEVEGNEEKTVEVGKRYRETFLALGGSFHPSQVFRKFRGRDPSPKPLFKSLGLKETEPSQEL